ncbi:autotransporter domain-containing protein [Pseudomonas sp. Fl5BN2]|uniref:autotransporter domain-containing protein n=1 Tax=Pseudomonas sp. Fl5BN2 TaxID=2697652 RepID=UPI00137712F8|nr:autotransporter domain-containing protein [Pseudomonas sp. Fl5BN2]NBF03223.1 autotransporter domain-containing protein [Pseudomonas sp. Fl5BN2]
MNRAFRIIWSHTRQAFVVADKLASAHGNHSSARLLLIAAGTSCLALANSGMVLAQERCTTMEVEISDNGSGNDSCKLHSSGQGSVEVNATLMKIGGDAITAPNGFNVITNNGTVLGNGIGSGINLTGNSTGYKIVNQQDSTIQGGKNGIALSNGYRLRSLINAGQIVSYNIKGAGVSIDNASIGSLHNQATGSISNADSGNAIYLINNALILDSLVNDGEISSNGGHAAIYGSSSGIGHDLLNNGRITNLGDGNQSAIELNGFTIGGNLVNAKNAVIDGGEGAIRLTGSTITGTLDNQGLLNSRGATASVSLDKSHVDSIRNTGTIQGLVTGLRLESSTTNSITNESGATINGGYSGLLINSGSSVGSLTNSGRIEGSVYAVYVGSEKATTLSNIDIGGIDTAAFLGDVQAKGTDVTIKSGAVFSNHNAFEVQRFTVEKGATFNLGASTSTSGMAEGIYVSNGLQNNGTLALASGVTGTVHGAYTQTSDGTLKIGVANEKTYGRLVVDGIATLPSNARIAVDVSNPGYSFSAKTLQDVLSAGTLVSDGTFSVTDNSLLFNFGAVKDANTVDLTLVAAGGTSDPSGANRTGLVEEIVRNRGNSPAVGAARVLDHAFTSNPTGELAKHFVGLTNARDVSDAVTQTLPTVAGNANNATRGTLASINRVVQARQESNSGLSSGDAVQAENNLWIKPFGSWAEQDERSGISGYSASTQGMAIGADAAVSEFARLGLAFAYARTDLDNHSHVAPQDAKIDTYQLIGYASYALTPETELNFQLDGGQNRSEGKRHMPFADATATADYNGYNVHAGLGIGRTLRLSEQLTFVPSARADYTWIGTEAYREKGAGALNLNVDSNDSEELLLGVDGKFNYLLSDATVLNANLGAGYDVIDAGSSITSAYAGAPGAAFHTKGMDIEPWLARAGLGLTHTLDNGTEVSLRYDAEARSGFTNQGASIKARWAL